MKPNITVENVPGFRVSTAQANIRDWEAPRDDLALIVADAPATAAGVFTQSKVVAAPVKISRRHLKATGGMARAVLVNAGVANACTGKTGCENALATARRLADRLKAPPEQILVASTGVIGRQLPMDRMEAGIDQAIDAPGSAGAGAFARAIMTTDTRPKHAEAGIDGFEGVVVAGACKGSGMIAPNMATMLAFILTNAAVSPKALREATRIVADETFNRATVDGDTSTNDSLFVLASGVAGAAAVDKPSGKRFERFLEGLHDVALSLAVMLVRDGEGATKLVRVRVVGATRHRDAVTAGRTIAESPLVKTAMFGNDPNWGRIMMALGRSGVRQDESKTTVKLCGRTMFHKGRPVEFNAEELSRLMRAPDVDIEVDLGLGDGTAEFLTCDFSYDYVRINADYTT
ncbi:MAG: bifunctional glutamate N-acetyltransferase/amino-acid acetyltransferase ArgJ [Planctomycetota bacterium]|jgi:glutamate N-acetyltransferase/amino-acid N-acetyltransferase|nr:bifunctional glutamate N-acetyltransferase/amino-acid acetyltransferase ArgJ [Planctomycetota bacterium]